MMLALAIVLVTAPAADLPGELGALRYFTSTDDGTHLWLVDWRVEGKEYGIMASDRSWADTVLAYERQGRSNQRVQYSALRDIGVVALMDNGNSALYEGTRRKQWSLDDWSSGSQKTIHYVEVAAPAGSRTAADVVAQYVKGEGAAKSSDVGTAPADIAKTINGACGGKLTANVGEAAKAGMVGRARAAAEAIAKLCADNDYKTAAARITEIKFSSSGKADTQVGLRGSTLDVAFGTVPLNTPATVKLWLKNNL